jgi:FtsP/CotA-like multicopper oxidase with cupredoxin domain
MRTPLSSLLLALAGVLLPAGAGAQPCPFIPPSGGACPNVEDQQDLRSIPEIVAQGGGINATFDVQMKTLCVPTTTQVGTRQDGDRTIKIYSSQALNLRTYVYSASPDNRVSWCYPGPTLRLKKATQPGGTGDSLAILLKNSLKPSSDSACDSACPSGTTCNPADLPALLTSCAANPNGPNCCCVIDLTQKAPNCFHGDNTTNLHFHGSHASPQPPQDYVLLELRPNGADTAAHSAHGGEIAYGQYQYRVDPFRWTQPEGTHWYHPHKHGSVSLQVANGMPGALIIEGPFDTWLRGFYQNKLVEKVLVLQQIEEKTNLFGQGGAPQVLVNGQINPTVTMKPGEVQRWRFVNATMKAGTQLAIYFPQGTTVRQIAMDGVQFSPVNYQCQPLYNPSPVPPCNMPPVSTPSVTISPGNRADFLVQAPLTETTLTVQRKVVGNVGADSRQRLFARDEALAPGADEPSLVTLRIDDGIEGKAGPLALTAAEVNMPTPEQWPKMPDFLRNIQPSEIVAPSVDLVFQQFQVNSTTPGAQGSPLTVFKINDRQYCASCVNVTTELGKAKEWNVSNVTALAHPFHIHINPFQVVRNGTVTYPEPIWQDTIGLPKGTTAAPGTVLLRQRYEEFTGEYVLHCHFLGHEDRGMMFGVQTTCKDDQAHYGTPNASGQPECTSASRLRPAAPQCPAGTSCPAPNPAGRYLEPTAGGTPESQPGGHAEHAGHQGGGG